MCASRLKALRKWLVRQLACVLRFGIARKQIERPVLVVDDLHDQNRRSILPRSDFAGGLCSGCGQQDVVRLRRKIRQRDENTARPAPDNTRKAGSHLPAPKAAHRPATRARIAPATSRGRCLFAESIRGMMTVAKIIIAIAVTAPLMIACAARRLLLAGGTDGARALFAIAKNQMPRQPEAPPSRSKAESSRSPLAKERHGRDCPVKQSSTAKVEPAPDRLEPIRVARALLRGQCAPKQQARNND